jgi:hypothetical protein
LTWLMVCGLPFAYFRSFYGLVYHSWCLWTIGNNDLLCLMALCIFFNHRWVIGLSGWYSNFFYRINLGILLKLPQGYLQIPFLQPLRERQRSKGISCSKTLVVIVWVLEYFEINEMNFVFVCFHWEITCDLGSSFVSGNYGRPCDCFWSFCHDVRSDYNLFWSIIMVGSLVHDNIRDNFILPNSICW